MKTAVLVGCGSKFGSKLLAKISDAGYKIYSISGSDQVENENLIPLKIDWSTFTVPELQKFLSVIENVDLVFFNQNSSSLNKSQFEINHFKTLNLWKQEKIWSQSYFASCILPFHIIHTLGNKCSDKTKIAWMLSSYIYNHRDIQHADYIGNKYQNYLLMKNFSQHHPSCFFGINPDSMEKNLDDLIRVLTNDDFNFDGNVVKFNGVPDPEFELFNKQNV